MMGANDFIRWFTYGCYHGFVIFFVYKFLGYDFALHSSGKPVGLFAFGMAIFSNVVIIVNLKVSLSI